MNLSVNVENETILLAVETTALGTITRKSFANTVKAIRSKYGKKARKIWYIAYEDCNLWYYAETEKPRKWPRRYASLIK